MTKKTASRRERDAQKRQVNGGKLPSARTDRERVSRAWYDLKGMHGESQKYIHQLAERMTQYMNLPVLAQIKKNGDDARFNELQNVELKKHTDVAMKEFAALWDSHKDRKGRCVTLSDMELAVNIAGNYEKFNADFFLAFQPIISEMNKIFNKALKQLLDAQDQATSEKLADAQVKAIDFNSPEPIYNEIPDRITGEAITDLDVPADVEDKIKARGELRSMVHIDDAAFIDPAKTGVLASLNQTDDAAFGALQMTGKVTHAEVASDNGIRMMAMVNEEGNPITETTTEPTTN